MTIGIIILVLALIILFISAYNKGIMLKNYVKEAFATMDVYLKKRWDLIPNLVEIVKGYSDFEKDTLSKVTELRTKNYAGLSNEEKLSINSELGTALSRLIAVNENYPELKSNEHYVKLMEQLNSIENDIANSRKYYNGTVREFNNYLEIFPTNIIGKMFNFQKESMFEIDKSERDNVKVEF